MKFDNEVSDTSATFKNSNDVLKIQQPLAFTLN